MARYTYGMKEQATPPRPPGEEETLRQGQRQDYASSPKTATTGTYLVVGGSHMFTDPNPGARNQNVVLIVHAGDTVVTSIDLSSQHPNKFKKVG